MVSAILRNDYENRKRGTEKKKKREKKKEIRDRQREGRRKVRIGAVKMALETEDDQRQRRAATMEGPPRAASHLSLAASSTEQSG